MSNQVQCRECGDQFDRITNTHLESKHEMSVEEYQDLYPDAPIDSPDLKRERAENTSEALKKYYEENPELREKRREDAIEQMKDPRQRKLRSEVMLEIDRDEEWRENISEAKEGDPTHRDIALSKLVEGEEPSCSKCGKLESEEIEDVGRKLHTHHKNGNPNDDRPENIAFLCSSCHTGLHNKLRASTEKFTGNRRIVRNVSHILDELGVDQKDPDFRATPERVSRMFVETCQRCFEDDGERISQILSTTFPEAHDDFVVVDNIIAHSMCPHHLRVIDYEVDFGYIPAGQIIGLSKIPRLVKYLAKKPMTQEVYTEEIADRFYDTVQPRACIVHVRGEHHCMTSRGVETHGSRTTTSALRGEAHPDDGDPHIKQEFFDLVGETR